MVVLIGNHSILPQENDNKKQEKIQFIWPIDSEDLSKKISSLFGESRGDHFHNGLDISSYNEPISLIGEGKLIYSKYSEDNPFEEDLGSGNCIWFSHDNGYQSAYYHLKEGRNYEILEKISIKSGEVFARTGNTGHSTGAHLHFVITKDGGKKIIDPLRVLPKVEDNYPPDIKQLILTIGEKYSVIKNNESLNVSRNFPVSVAMNDKGLNKAHRRGISSARFIVNGELTKEIRFQEISYLNGKWINEDNLTFDDLYFDGKYFIGNLEFRSGENKIEIIASDFYNNRAYKKFTFFINKIRGKY
ncbi:MAG: M23 family metallopeptidase [Leptospiraceae bacterium]|nr:M23 family metallopeptidase [Leptospiraceae bacterium]MCP5497247.1 M23 family metallopeptidase [Leptospiraceae bacterium]